MARTSARGGGGRGSGPRETRGSPVSSDPPAN